MGLLIQVVNEEHKFFNKKIILAKKDFKSPKVFNKVP